MKNQIIWGIFQRAMQGNLIVWAQSAPPRVEYGLVSKNASKDVSCLCTQNESEWIQMLPNSFQNLLKHDIYIKFNLSHIFCSQLILCITIFNFLCCLPLRNVGDFPLCFNISHVYRYRCPASGARTSYIHCKCFVCRIHRCLSVF